MNIHNDDIENVPMLNKTLEKKDQNDKIVNKLNNLMSARAHTPADSIYRILHCV